MKQPRLALIFEQSDKNETLSYQHGWPKAILESSLFDCDSFNLADLTMIDEAAVGLSLARRRYDAIILLHSVFSNQQNLRRLAFLGVFLSRAPKIFFIGNEYKLMPEKMLFCRRLGVDLLITQSNDPRVLERYEQALGCMVESLPNTGFDPTVFSPRTLLKTRKLDIGYRAFAAPWYLGNNEKLEIAELFLQSANRFGLRVDISLDPDERFNTSEYAFFLNCCRGQIGTESGGDYFELTDNTRTRVNTYLNHHPEAGWPQIKKQFFDTLPNGTPMRVISGRQVEAAACKTVQILYDGSYNGFLKADEHYISLKKDGSNLTDVIQRFRDDAYCERITKNAYDVVMDELTYHKLVQKFAVLLNKVLR